MGKIFETQDWLRINLTYTANISASIASAKIKYEKPNGVTGFWVGVHDAGNKKVYYDLPQGNPLGVSSATIKRWKFWIFATANDSRVAPGEVATELVHEEGVDKQ